MKPFDITKMSEDNQKIDENATASQKDIFEEIIQIADEMGIEISASKLKDEEIIVLSKKLYKFESILGNWLNIIAGGAVSLAIGYVCTRSWIKTPLIGLIGGFLLQKYYCKFLYYEVYIRRLLRFNCCKS